MGIDLKDWLDHCRQHPLLFRFDGLHGHGRSQKGDFHQTVGEAAISDERFMDEYMGDEESSIREDFDRAVKDREDHDEILSRFAEFCEHKKSHYAWDRDGLPNIGDWSKASMDDVLKVVDEYSEEENLVWEYIRDWVMSPIEHYWDIIKDDEELIKEHPPVAVWYHAGEYEIPLKDVFFVCPACHGEPHTEEGLIEFHGKQNGYPYFYCGSCGSEMNAGRTEDIRDFFLAMGIEPYPFNPTKKAEWKKILEARRAWGNNKQELVVHERIHIKKSEERDGHFGAGGEKWTTWLNEPGDLVEISRVDENGVMAFHIDDVEHEFFIRFDHIYGRPKEAVL